MAHGAFGAMGGQQTSAIDYAKWVVYLLSGWPPRDDAEPTLATPSTSTLPSPCNRALTALAICCRERIVALTCSHFIAEHADDESVSPTALLLRGAKGLQSVNGKENLLDGFHRARSSGGFPAADLVGAGCDHPYFIHLLVGRLS